MAIDSARFTGNWKIRDIIAAGAERASEASDIRGPDGKPEIAESYLAHGVLVGREPINVRAAVPRKVYNKVVKLLAPYLIDEAVITFSGTTKNADVGTPDPTDNE